MRWRSNGEKFPLLIGWSLLSKFWESVKGQEAWCAAAHGVAKSWTWFSDWTATVGRRTVDTGREKNQTPFHSGTQFEISVSSQMSRQITLQWALLCNLGKQSVVWGYTHAFQWCPWGTRHVYLDGLNFYLHAPGGCRHQSLPLQITVHILHFFQELL